MHEFKYDVQTAINQATVIRYVIVVLCMLITSCMQAPVAGSKRGRGRKKQSTPVHSEEGDAEAAAGGLAEPALKRQASGRSRARPVYAGTRFITL